MLRAAAAAGLAVAPQGTGHGAAPLQGRLGDAVLLRTAALGELSIDEDRRIARVGAGMLWGDLVDAAGTVGLAGLHPSSPDVGVAGYSIGGGIGWYTRRLGLQCNALTAAEVVLADGTFVRATADSDTELFWGLRGSGMPLGVVTALEFELLRHRQRRRGLPGLGLDRGRARAAELGGLVRRGPGRGDDVLPGAARPAGPVGCPPSCATAGWWSSTARCSGRTARRPRSSRRCAPSPRSSTR